MISLILTVIGPDRPGLVEALSDTIKRHDANWLESEMAQLVGHFAGIVHVQVPEAAADPLTADLVNLQNKGLAVQVTPAPAPGTMAAANAESGALVAGNQTTTYHLELLGLDRPGIVRDLAHALATRSINVAQLKTQTQSAPMSGEQMFKATAHLHAPRDTNTDELHDALDQLAVDLDLDLTLTEAQKI
ncbi:MAG: ACT domain-containing protein [Planctomycetota bacterium]